MNLDGFYNGQNDTFVGRYNAKTMLGRMADDTDVTGTIVYLTSDASAYLTGSSITLDGGYSAK